MFRLTEMVTKLLRNHNYFHWNFLVDDPEKLVFQVKPGMFAISGNLEQNVARNRATLV